MQQIQQTQEHSGIIQSSQPSKSVPSLPHILISGVFEQNWVYVVEVLTLSRGFYIFGKHLKRAFQQYYNFSIKSKTAENPLLRNLL